MAEAAGLAIGVAALFDTCIESFKIIFAAQDFAKEFELLNVIFQQQRLRLFLWDESVGLISRSETGPRPYFEELDDEHVRPTILRSLKSIQYLLGQFKTYGSRYGVKDTALSSLVNISGPSALDEDFRTLTARNQKQKSIKTVTKWAMFDAEKMKGANEQLRSLIDGLNDITNELRRMKELRDSTIATRDPTRRLCNNNSDVPGYEPALGMRRFVPSSTTSRQIEALDLHSFDTFHTASATKESLADFVSALEFNASVRQTTSAHNVSQQCPEPLQSAAAPISRHPARGSRESVDTYATTPMSQKSLLERRIGFNEVVQHSEAAEISSPWYPQEICTIGPEDFTALFPTHQKLLITHDNTSRDGNMNVMIYLPAMLGLQQRKYLSLFYLRMHDLRKRNFSFRRFSRDSGREICRTRLGLIKRVQTKSRSRSKTTLRSPSNRSFTTGIT